MKSLYRLPLRHAVLAAMAVALFAIALGGCGKSSSDASSGSDSSGSASTSGSVKSAAVGNSNVASPQAAFLAYASSAQSKDFAAVCARMTNTMQAATVKQIKAAQAAKTKVPGLSSAKIAGCADAAHVLLGAVPSNQWGEIRKFGQGAKTTTKGDHATLTGPKATIYLTKVNGHWLLDQPPVAASAATSTSSSSS
jgi:hypothetical protein